MPEAPRQGGPSGVRPAREQLGVQGLDVVAGRDAQVVAQALTQRVVDEQRLGDVPTRREDLHQEAMAALAVRREGGQGASGALGEVELPGAQAQAGGGEGLQGAKLNLLERATLLVDPARFEAGEEPAPGHVDGYVRGNPGASPLALRDRRVGAVDRLGGLLDVDRRIAGKREADLCLALDQVASERDAQL